jgi:hypothetical protein
MALADVFEQPFGIGGDGCRERPRRADDLRSAFALPRVLRKSMNTPVSK